MFRTELSGTAIPPRCWRLDKPLIWEAHGRRYEIPAGFVSDLASIPWVFRWALDTNGASRRAAVLHDWLYDQGEESRKYADDLFRAALKAEGVRAPGRFTYWAGVRLGGWYPWRNHRRRDARAGDRDLAEDLQ